MPKKPLISVVMSVYNGSNFVEEAIESVLNQTLDNFEFIIIDDDSQDHSINIIKSFNDKRIKLRKNNNNLGQSESLNKGIRLSKGEFIARIDQDDICLPERFEVQYKYMMDNPEIGILGSQSYILNENESKMSMWNKRPESHYQNMWTLMHSSSLVHPTVMIRRSVLNGNDLFNKIYSPSDDYELWSRLVFKTKINQINTPLVIKRRHSENTGNKFYNTKKRNRFIIQKRYIIKLYKIEPYFEYFFQQYRFSKVFDIPSSRIKRLIGIIQIMYYFYYFTNKYKVMNSDKKWIKGDILKLIKSKYEHYFIKSILIC